MHRNPIAQGKFYPATKEEVFDTIASIENTVKYTPPQDRPSIIGAVLPHAGHHYSGYQTIPFFKILQKHQITFDTYIILSPNHTGIGPKIAIDEHDSWSNCIGEVELDTQLIEKLPFLNDASAHANEHSGEVIIPFIQYYAPNPVKIVPICIKPLEQSEVIDVAQALYKAVQSTNQSTVVIASSDFSHFLPPGKGYQKDQTVLDQVLQRNTEGVKNAVLSNEVSVCGYCPITILMEYSALVSTHYVVDILERGHSGMVQPSHDVVNYISMLFKK